MVQYSQETNHIAQAYNITPEKVILAFALAAGAPYADAYRIITRQKIGITAAQCETECKQLINNNPGIKILIHRIKNHQNPITLTKEKQKEIKEEEIKKEISEEAENEYKTRQGLIKKIINSVYSSSGKEEITGLTTLAKMQGFDKPDEQTEEEKRVYFLPWVSNCRSCALMKMYRDVINKKDG